MHIYTDKQELPIDNFTMIIKQQITLREFIEDGLNPSVRG